MALIRSNSGKAGKGNEQMKSVDIEKVIEGKSTAYNVGQKVFHPFHGVGTIVKKDVKKEILGETMNFSVIEFERKRMKLMLNLEKEHMVKMITQEVEIPRLKEIMSKTDSEFIRKKRRRGHKRYKKSVDRMKDADIYTMAKVVRDLSILKQRKKITSKEKKLFKKAQEILFDAVSKVNGMELEEAQEMIEGFMNPEEANA